MVRVCRSARVQQGWTGLLVCFWLCPVWLPRSECQSFPVCFLLWIILWVFRWEQREILVSVLVKMSFSLTIAGLESTRGCSSVSFRILNFFHRMLYFSSSLLPSFAVLGIEARALYMLGKPCTTKLCPQPLLLWFLWLRVDYVYTYTPNLINPITLK